MNKEREEQMRKAAWEYAEENGVDCSHDMTCICDFCAGWRAADSIPNWIPVEERLPDEGQEVVAWHKIDCQWHRCIFEVGWFVHFPVVFEKENITHWMEIQPPQRKEE